MSCMTPPGDRAGTVHVHLAWMQSPYLQPSRTRRPLHFTYHDEAQQDGLSMAIHHNNTALLPDEDMYDAFSSQCGPNMQQTQQGNITNNYHMGQYNMDQASRHRDKVSSPTSETPPSYEEVTTKEEREKHERRQQDSKIPSWLQARIEKRLDLHIGKHFSSTQTEKSKAMSSSTKDSVQTESSKNSAEAAEAERQRLLLFGRKREVKGLGKDYKLWGIWVCHHPALFFQSLAIRQTLLTHLKGTNPVSCPRHDAHLLRPCPRIPLLVRFCLFLRIHPSRRSVRRCSRPGSPAGCRCIMTSCYIILFHNPCTVQIC